MNNIEKILTNWGQSQQTFPNNHQLMKNEMLSKLSKTKENDKQKFTFRVPWLPLAFTGLAALVLVLNTFNPAKINQTMAPSRGDVNTASPYHQIVLKDKKTVVDEQYKSLDKTDSVMSNSAAPSSAGMPQQNYIEERQKLLSPPVVDQKSIPIYPPQLQTTPISDNREFLKTDYSASIKTRDVQNLSTQLQTIIRGFDGRIDGSNNSQEGGYISFVIPANKLDVFKTQVKNLAGYRFYLETQSSENLLSQKRSIESQQTSTQTTLDQLNNSLVQLNQSHAQTVASLQSQINSAAGKLKLLQNERPTNTNRAYEIETQKQELQNQIKNLQNSLAQENNNYNSQLSSLNWQISDKQNNLNQLNDQTNNLLDTVATVHGTISLTWISLFELWDIYLPYYWAVIMLLAAAAVSYFATRKLKMVIP